MSQYLLDLPYVVFSVEPTFILTPSYMLQWLMGAAPKLNLQSPKTLSTITVEQYLLLEEKNSDVRHEFYHGLVRAMSGGTIAHNRITNNITRHLLNNALAHHCDVFSSDIRLQVSGTHYFYPDVVVTCEDIQDEQNNIIKACFVAEVLSTSTINTDFGSKLILYTQNPYIQTILYVHQTEKKVFVYQKNQNSTWETRELSSGEFSIPCINASLTLDQIYERTSIVAV